MAIQPYTSHSAVHTQTQTQTESEAFKTRYDTCFNYFTCYLLFEIAHRVFSIIVLHSHRRCFLPSTTVGYVFTGVCLSTGEGVHPLGRHPPSGQTPPHLGRHPPGRHPLAETPLPIRRPQQRKVRILLECILVATKVTLVSGGSRIFLRRDANSQSGIILQTFCRKLHEK